jgi:hypothetical protein
MTFFLLGLAACNDTIEPSPIPMQHWKEMDIQIETHPNPPLEGMSEVVVIVTSRGKPVHDLIISLRADDSAPWVQTIQDGYIGVYRRGVSVGFDENAVLQVLLQRGQEKKVLFFPLKLAAG